MWGGSEKARRGRAAAARRVRDGLRARLESAPGSGGRDGSDGRVPSVGDTRHGSGVGFAAGGGSRAASGR
mgnify:CR=1 FL=1